MRHKYIFTSHNFSDRLNDYGQPDRLMKLQTLLLYILALLVVGCANPGSGPDGGPYDETPPRIVEMNPPIGTCNAKAKKVSIVFDELIKVEDVQEKIIVSPPQTEMPEIKVSGRRISVELLDTLKENVTYTIDFSDAIVDSNEGNPLGNFTYYFSTGAQIDSMEVSGFVLAAENLEPVSGILVGLHSNMADSAFVSAPFERVARTDGAGHFSIKGVSPGKYRIYALKDIDNDFKYTRGEMLAFNRDTIIPEAFPDVRMDTLWADTVHIDTIKQVAYTHFMPDNVTLLAFTEKNLIRQFLKSQREPEYFKIFFTAPSTQIPVARLLNSQIKNPWIEERTIGNDTITYWLRDTALINCDTLRVEYSYEAVNDSTFEAYTQVDTLELIPKFGYAKRQKFKAEDMEKWQKELEKRHRKGDFTQETPPVEPLKIDYAISSSLAPDQNLKFRLPEPAERIDTTGIHLFLKVDSIYVEAAYRLEQDTLSLRDYTLRSEWRPGQEYVLNIDSACIAGISGKVNAAYDVKVSIPPIEKYGALFLIIPDADSTALVQLLSKDEGIIKQLPVVKGRVDFFYLKPGTVYARLINDRNGNGRWDEGNYEEGVMPEEVYYFPKRFEIRENWDVEQTWTLTEVPMFKQKPVEIIKQKEVKKRTPKNRNAERERAKRSM